MWRPASRRPGPSGSRAGRSGRTTGPPLRPRWAPTEPCGRLSGSKSTSCWDGISRTAARGSGARPGPAAPPGRTRSGTSTPKGFADAWDVVEAQAQRVPELRAATEGFVSAFWSSDLSPVVKEAALFNLSTLRSQTFFRTADGNPLGWEGCLDDVGSCLGSCTHVWNYELATSFLFGSMARQMRELEYLHATADDGAMSFRIMLPLDKAQEYAQVAADGQFGCVVKLFREWRLSGDVRMAEAALAGLPAVARVRLDRRRMGRGPRRPGRGRQHNTMDIEYFGPNPEVQPGTWRHWRPPSMAEAVGDTEFSETAGRCSRPVRRRPRPCCSMAGTTSRR